MGAQSLHSIELKKVIRQSIWRITFLLLIALPYSLSAQNFFFDNYGVVDGLAQSTIFDIHQDENHNIWLGTRAGVSKFDGKSFVNFSIENGLAPNGVKVIFRDANNRIYLGHVGGGISILENNKFSIFSKPEEVFNSDITAIASDSSGVIWISSELTGTIKLTDAKKSLKESKYEHFIGNELSDRVYGARTLKNGETIFITDAFLKRYNLKEQKFENFEIDGMPRFFQITNFYEDSKGHLWFGTYHGGLYEYQTDLKTFKFYDYLRDGIGSNWITVISEGAKGEIYVGTWGGGLTKIEKGVVSNYNLNNGLNDSKIRQLFTDAEGNILIGTNEHGLSIFKGELFTNYFSNNERYNSQIETILADSKGKIWFGTYEGIMIYNPKEKSETSISKFYKLEKDKIKIIKEDSKGRIWIATDNQGIFTYIPDKEQYTYDGLLNSDIYSLTVTALECDIYGNIWVGTLEGLIKYNFDTKELVRFTQTDGLAANEVTSLFIDKNQKIWIGTKGKGVTTYTKGKFGIKKLQENITATCFSELNNKELWIGTDAHGIMVYNTINDTILKIYNEQNGIFANQIKLLLCDDKSVYIGTNKGLNILDLSANRIYGYSKRNGFTGIETKTNAITRDGQNNIWIGTINGAFKMNTKLITHSTLEPLTHIVKMKVNLEDVVMKKGMSLRYNNNNIIFEISSICLANPDAVKYKVLLEGADKDWRFVTETTLNYPALAPNTYIFNVLAQNSDGVWNREPIKYSFTINPPFYKTWWFILIITILGGFGILLYIKIRVKNLKEQNRILEERVEERTATVVAQKEELAEKNKDITDSIQYAKRIQFAVLPDEIPFKETFVLLKPKDIVSGDFYWIHEHNELEFIAAVDCTGHGVPGAFMSIIGINMFNKIIKENHIYQPSKVLDALNRELLLSLPSQEGEVIQDGMDLSIICYNRNTRELQYAGAFNPLYVIKNGDIEEIKADRFSIGRTSLEMESHFTNHTLKMEQGDCIYLFSDGYADQFGGDEGKKFKYKTLKDLLITIHKEPMLVQKEILDTTIEKWRGELEQVDDILMVGRRF